METADLTNMPVEQKIVYGRILTKVFMFFSLVFILGYAVVKLMTGDNNLWTAEIGFVCVALFGVFAWITRKLEMEVQGESTFHQQG